MQIELLKLKYYRNLKDTELELSPGVNIFLGDNAQGKTNLLEAVYLCASGRSRRAKSDKEMISFGREEAFIQTIAQKNGFHTKVDIHLRHNRTKGAAIDGIPIRAVSELFGNFICVLFAPEDLQLVKSGPGERRRFIDMELCQISKPYVYHLQTYHKVLKQRNNLLRTLRKNQTMQLLDSLEAWDSQLVEHGEKLHNMRSSYISLLGGAAAAIYTEIAAGEEFYLKYKPDTQPEELKEALKRTLERDIAQGATSTGIHKDDISFTISGEDARYYASQGQQRTAALCAKLAQARVVSETKGYPPVLLLDDVLSELDYSRQNQLIRYISNTQTILTCTGIEDALKNIAGQVNTYRVRKGEILKNK